MKRILAGLVSGSFLLGGGTLGSPPAAFTQLPHAGTATTARIHTADMDREIRDFLRREITAHVADIKTLEPPPDRVVGALTTGDFSWGTFMRALAEYSVLSGDRTVAGRDIPAFIGKIGLIEARNGGKTFAQLYAALALSAFGADLQNNPVWQSLSAEERESWRSLLDPARFYDREKHEVIHLPENYFGVASRIAAVSSELGIVTDRAYVDEILDRAARQFKDGSLFADDALPEGRFDRYSQEYARYVYDAAEIAGRRDILQALEPSLKAQMHLWWDLLSPDGYGYPWGRSQGAIGYMDTLEIVAFLAKHPQFRPAPMSALASAYYCAWRWLRADFQDRTHLLSVFAFGRGNYSYITKDREWQQTTAFFGKFIGAHKKFIDVLQHEGIADFSSAIHLNDVARFEFFRRGPRPEGVWLVRQGFVHFALPITTGTKAGISDYLPAPFGLPGFSAPVEIAYPAFVPYLELNDGRTIVASDGADEIRPAADGRSLTATWNRWVVAGGTAAGLINPEISATVSWRLEGNRLHRIETLTSTRSIHINRWWMGLPTTADAASISRVGDIRSDKFQSREAKLDFRLLRSDWPINEQIRATGDSVVGRGPREGIPLIVVLSSPGFDLAPRHARSWECEIAVSPPDSARLGDFGPVPLSTGDVRH
ncbi:MAG TPA: hypothetical protein VFO34_06390 [Candidatus Acidoferrales bacterium]|nr:hypothetical protein [Candidatus Acidoferrales bacterium]